MKASFFPIAAVISHIMITLSACQPKVFIRGEQRFAADPSSPLKHSVLLIGDCGKPAPDSGEANLNLLNIMANEAGNKATVLFLGDNIYDAGLPEASALDYPEKERRLKAQTESVKNSGAHAYMIPGNHDWDMMGKGGWDAVKREEAFVQTEWTGYNSFRPDQGCPGPSVERLTPEITLLMLDSQWWLHKHDKPGKADGCSADTPAEFIQALRDSLNAYKETQLIVAAHHPVWTYGTHGGRFGWKYHLFPLLMAKKNLFVPLPVLGTLAVLARKLGGTSQDCSHPLYRRYRKELRALFAEHPGLIYVAGHEHNLQYNQEGGIHYIVSGSGTKSQALGHGKHAQYTRGEKGFARIDIFEDGSRVLKFILPQGGCTVDYSTGL